MADDHNQRAYRGSDLSSRSAAGSGSSGSDPLAELARLIGQTDPFAEYGRNTAQRAPTVPGQQAPGAWPDDTAAYPADQQGAAEPNTYADPHYANGGYARSAYGSAPLSADSAQLYQVDAHAPGYASQGYDADPYAAGAAGGYDQAFPPSQEPLHDVHQQFGPAPTDDYYDDVAPSRRRISVLAIAGVFALAVLGTAGALGYRAVFGPSSVPSTPPVIKADATPSKVVPATANKEPGKVTDRVGANGQIERLLSREEQPVPVVTTPNQPPANNALVTNGAPAMGSGVVGEPRKIRTIPIRPDQSADSASAAAPAAPEPMPSAAQPPVRVVNAAPVAEPPRPAVQPAQPPRNVTPQAAAPAQPAPQQQAPPQAAQPSHAPLSLNPNAQPARPAAPARVAAQTPAPQAAAPASGGYAVQVSSQRSEAEAQAAFQSLQGKFPNQLGGRQPVIRRADLGEKGIYYRAMVVVGSNSEAGELCSSLKAAGGSCIIQRN